MEQLIKDMIVRALKKARDTGDLVSEKPPEFVVEEPNLDTHGDYSVNAAMQMARTEKKPPRKIAESLCKHIQDPMGILDRTEIAGPGFINFYLKPEAWLGVLTQVHKQGADYGATDIGKGTRVLLEFVSANPTGPLTVGHGRGAALGDSLARLLRFCGYDLETEYYINDSGRQIRQLGRSVYLRFLQQKGTETAFPEDCYQGDYIREIAGKISRENLAALADMEEEEAIDWCARFAMPLMLAEIREDLESFGVTFDRWFSEQALYDDSRVDEAIEQFKGQGLVYEKDGALWFKTSDYGDEKDRVVVRSNGMTTYFASDIAYHKDKFERGYGHLIDVWGADHHGYVARVKAAITALGFDPENFFVPLVKLVTLTRAGQPVKMGKRAGNYVTLREVIDEVGPDPARLIYLSRDHESPLDFDLEEAKEQKADNPVFYVQYAHARIASIESKAAREGLLANGSFGEGAKGLMTEPEEVRLMKQLHKFPQAVRKAASTMEPHRMSVYLTELASLFHTFYNKCRVIGDDPDVSSARLFLVGAVKQVIQSGLALLGATAPETM